MRTYFHSLLLVFACAMFLEELFLENALENRRMQLLAQNALAQGLHFSHLLIDSYCLLVKHENLFNLSSCLLL